MRSLALALGAIVAVSAGCGSPNQDPDSGTNPVEDAGVVEDAGTPDAGKPKPKPDAGPIDAGFASFGVEQWCDMYALARCHRLERCLSLASENAANCIAREKSACDQAAYSSGVDQGRLQYLPQEAANCVNAHGHGACTGTPVQCETVFQGLVATDGGCLVADECQSGNYCLLYENKCPFTCYRYQDVGESCNWWDRQCDPQLGNCKNVDGGNHCVARGALGGSCQYFSDCQQGLACINGTCIRQIANEGEPCRENQGYPYCETGTFCRQDFNATGDPIDAGVCLPKAGLGGVCAGGDSCATGMRCSSAYATGTCIPLGAVNATCTNYNDCQSELYCDPPSSRCLPLPVEGGDCSSQGSFYRCAPGFYCDYQTDTCKARLELGEPCSYNDTWCLSNSCEFGTLPDGGNGPRCVESCASRYDGGS